MELVDVQAAADAAVWRAKTRAEDADTARAAVIAMAQAYADSDDEVVATNSWPLVWVRGEHVAQRSQLLQAVSATMGVTAAISGENVTPGGHSQSWRLNGVRTRLEAAAVVFEMLVACMYAATDPGGEAVWVDGVVIELGGKPRPRTGVSDYEAQHPMFEQLYPAAAPPWTPAEVREEIVGVLLAQALGERAHLIEALLPDVPEDQVRQTVELVDLLGEQCQMVGIPVSMMLPVRARLRGIVDVAQTRIATGYATGDRDRVRAGLRELIQQMRIRRDWLLDGCDAADVERLDVDPYSNRYRVTIAGKIGWLGSLLLNCTACGSTVGWVLRTIPTGPSVDTTITCTPCGQVRNWHPMVYPQSVIAIWRGTQVPDQQPLGWHMARPHRRVVTDGVVSWVPWRQVSEEYWQREWPELFAALRQWLAEE